jgi:hypothetical protein
MIETYYVTGYRFSCNVSAKDCSEHVAPKVRDAAPMARVPLSNEVHSTRSSLRGRSQSLRSSGVSASSRDILGVNQGRIRVLA